VATATSGSWTATMTFATVAQADLYVRYQTTRETIRTLKIALLAKRIAGGVSAEDYADKRACLVSLFDQNEALWESQRPSVRWLQVEPIEEIPIGEITP